MVKISMDSGVIDQIVGDIEKFGNNLDVSIKNISLPISCSGIMITEYVYRIQRISSILTKYKYLIDKDVADIKAAKDLIIQMDSHMQKLY